MKTLKFLIIGLTFLTTFVFTQETKITLPTDDNTSSFVVDGSNVAQTMKFYADGGFFLNGFQGTGTVPLEGPGNRLVWYPGKAAFRAGSVGETQWNDVNIGSYSSAMGFNTTASGNFSLAMGYGTTSQGYASTAIGKYNVGGGTTDSWVSTDPIFEIGIGADTDHPANAMTVLKNGNTTIAGSVKSESGGFIFPDGTTQTTAATSSQWVSSGNNLYNGNTGNVGVNKTTPITQLHVGGTDGLLVEGTFGVGTAISPGAGTRMHFYPGKASFRAGSVGGTHWDLANIGNYSSAMGFNTIASGGFSFAMGHTTTASGNYSTAMGINATAGGESAFAYGDNVTASGNNSIAIGENVIASGDHSTSVGNYCTNNAVGSFMLTDYCPAQTTQPRLVNSLPYSMNMRFHGGYILYTDDNLLVGALLGADQSSWSTWSDSTKKENVLIADGEYFLNSISKLKLGSWNYKEQDPKDFRHYGPMAQEIFHYFGNDGIGTIGCDTLLTSADMDGIMMIAIQALEKRTSENRKLELRIQKLEEEKAKAEENYTKVEIKNSKLEERNNEIQDRLTKLEGMVEALLKEKVDVAKND